MKPCPVFTNAVHRSKGKEGVTEVGTQGAVLYKVVPGSPLSFHLSRGLMNRVGNHAGIWAEGILGRGKSKCADP